MSAPTSTATGRVIVHEAELEGPIQRGRHIRAYCHIHGGDRQRSLSINAENGFGECFNCHAKVFVPELNPEGMRGQDARQERRITPASLLRPAMRRVAGEPTPEPWQREELAALYQLDERMRARLSDERARAYLAARGIALDVATAAGVGYVPADARLSGPLAKWRDRLIFPLGSTAGRGYAGRSLWGWQPGMDENAHKALLEASQGAPRRWEKTYPAGWLGYESLAGAEYVVIVEGPVDALALMSADMLDDVPVVALVGTAGRPDWLPANVRGLVLALDGDKGGSEAARNVARELAMAGVAVSLCLPPVEDGQGKDWAERWRIAQHAGVWPVVEALDGLLDSAAPVPPPPSSSAPAKPPMPEAPPEPPPARVVVPTSDLVAEALADPTVRELLGEGYVLLSVAPASPFLRDGYMRDKPHAPEPGVCLAHEYARLRALDGQRLCINCHAPEEASLN